MSIFTIFKKAPLFEAHLLHEALLGLSLDALLGLLGLSQTPFIYSVDLHGAHIFLWGTILNLVYSTMNKIDGTPCLHRAHILVRAKHTVNKVISN